jgi:hypothetical protein
MPLPTPYVEKGMFAEALADLEAERSKMDLRTYWASRLTTAGRAVVRKRGVR